jgi:RNA-dependent RNA polymerase
MSANGIPDSLFLELFENAVVNIRGLKSRVQNKTLTKGDTDLMAMSSEVGLLSWIEQRILTCCQFSLKPLIRAGFHNDPLVLDIVSIIECRALQDLK